MFTIRGSLIGLVGVVGGGLLAWPAVTAADTPEVEPYKRDERATELVLADVEDDDESRDRDTGTQNAGTQNTGTQASRETGYGADRVRGVDLTHDATDDSRGQSRVSAGTDASRDASRHSGVSRGDSWDASHHDPIGESRDDSSAG